jgi:transposase-like protein
MSGSMSTMSRHSGIDLVENLITNVEKHPPIYDKSIPEYKDVEKKEDMWKAIAAKLSIGGKWIYLFNQCLGINICCPKQLRCCQATDPTLDMK